MATRRQFSLGLGTTLAAGPMARYARAAGLRAESDPDALRHRLAGIEARCGGRLGVGILDTETGVTVEHRGDERFPMCSTHKALSAAAILAKVDKGEEHLDRRIRFPANAVLTYSPATKAHAGAEGMTLAEICAGAVALSDNTAANLMLEVLAGPAGLTAWLRSIGDDVTRLDRTEPTLNEALPGDPRDTTSPLAMAATLNRLVLGETLSPASRAQFTAWLVAGQTGGARLRAGVPTGWQVGQKTGTNDHGTANDVGVLWPPGRRPMVVTAFITGSTASLDAQNAAIADVAHLAAELSRA
ncbi:class A beta-lactamase [Roseomonas indoligenes]|uniref:Beta-lactamase n=1 Tax=Roseomonas indoligenes TaxID=2820811 RepID=A0A940N4E5_9PROT|nr:class A beta-lactamase [Pararoseomonas indoligenes]MBP0494975.1 class A beta-lactamase [Pararoseomonas indoligenes]